MNPLDPPRATVDAEGRLVIPPEVAARLGLVPGSTVLVDEERNSLRLRHPVEHLTKVYVQPMVSGDVPSAACARDPRPEPPGGMTGETFDRILSGLGAFASLPAVLFGGPGEPLAHPGIVEMVARAKTAGAPKVELISQGYLLGEKMAKQLIQAGLDTLWVSLDGIRPESYADARLGALLPRVLENLKRFGEIRLHKQIADLSSEEREHLRINYLWFQQFWSLPEPTPALGIVFVAMKRNIADLPQLLLEMHELGARYFLVTNVLPHSEALLNEMLYRDRLGITPFPTLWSDRLSLPPMDVDEVTRQPLQAAIRSYGDGFTSTDTSNVTRRCPFVEAGSMSIDWRGRVFPCLPLTHGHDEVLPGVSRRVEARPVGDLAERTLAEIWMDSAYLAFRRRVQELDFAPCDGCLYSQGLILCP